MKVAFWNLEKDLNGIPTVVRTREWESVEKVNLELVMPEMVFEFARKVIKADSLLEEYVWIIPVNVKNIVLGVMEVNHGSMEKSVLTTRDIFRRLLLVGAQSFFLVHNHPSGDPRPSLDDCSITTNIQKAGELMNIKMVDHIIVGGEEKYFSFREGNYGGENAK